MQRALMLSRGRQLAFVHKAPTKMLFSSAAEALPASSPALLKLQAVLDEYREKNFGQVMFSRFIKEMVQAADVNHDGKISQYELQKLLHSIGADDPVLSETELHVVMQELGGQPVSTSDEPLIPIDHVEELILQGENNNLYFGQE